MRTSWGEAMLGSWALLTSVSCLKYPPGSPRVEASKPWDSRANAAISAERLPPAGDDGHYHQGLMGQETRGNKQVEHLDLHPTTVPYR